MPRGRKKSTEAKEPKEEKSYSVVEEGNTIIEKLCEKYPEILWACEPKSIEVYGCDNAERPASSDTLAKIRPVTGVFKSVLAKHNIKLKYVIEIFWSDWQEWSLHEKQWIIFHEILHILDPEAKKMRKHNIEDFDLILDVIGLTGYKEGAPNLLGDKPIEFNKAIVARMHQPEEKDKAIQMSDGQEPPADLDEIPKGN